MRGRTVIGSVGAPTANWCAHATKAGSSNLMLLPRRTRSGSTWRVRAAASTDRVSNAQPMAKCVARCGNTAVALRTIGPMSWILALDAMQASKQDRSALGEPGAVGHRRR
jgi:hypothetical protein